MIESLSSLDGSVKTFLMILMGFVLFWVIKILFNVLEKNLLNKFLDISSIKLLIATHKETCNMEQKNENDKIYGMVREEIKDMKTEISKAIREVKNELSGDIKKVNDRLDKIVLR